MKKLSKKEWIATAIGLVLIIYVFYASNFINMFQSSMNVGNTLSFLDNNISGDLVVNQIVSGEGREAIKGDFLTIHYILSLTDGKTIANTKDFGIPFSFVLGSDEVIIGLNDGVLGMKKGEIRTIIIPPELGFGGVEYGPIPANSTLVFTVELIEIGSDIESQVE